MERRLTPPEIQGVRAVMAAAEADPQGRTTVTNASIFVMCVALLERHQLQLRVEGLEADLEAARRAKA